VPGLRLGEQLEDIAEPLARDAPPVILHPDLDPIPPGQNVKPDVAVLIRELGRVVQQVRDHRHHPYPIAPHCQGLPGDADGKAAVAPADLAVTHLQSSSNDLGEVEPFLAQLDLAPGDARDIEQVVDQAHQVGELAVHHLQGCSHAAASRSARTRSRPVRRGASGLRSSWARVARNSSLRRSAARNASSASSKSVMS
jgi:hypothetical protein